MADIDLTDGAESPVDEGVRKKLALALDLDDMVEAHRLAAALRPWFGVAKVGLELFSAAGPDAIGMLRDLGYGVFLDLKLFDIPTTVNRSTRVLGALGVEYLTLHALGGVDMLRAGVEGLADGAEKAGLEPPCALAVTVLTSDDTAPPHIVPNRVRVALEGGCGGLVLAAIGTASYGSFAAALLVMVTMGLALGGIGIMTSALESRVGAVSFNGPGGRVVAFPVLAAAFALFGGAGVGLPGMAGFVADDLLLHNLWMESPASTVAIILASAFLAVATLTGYSKTFLGRGVPSVAPDLLTRERLVAATLLVLLLVLGFMPGVLLTPADAFLSVTPPA